MQQRIWITVVVCTYNRVNLLRQALDSLARQTLDASLYEVLIINNNSTDNTQKLAEEFVARHKNFRVFIETEQGLSHGRNRGWKEAYGEYIAYMDDDAKAAPEWCEKILQAFENVKPKPTAVGGKIRPWYDVEPPEWFSDVLETRSWGEEAKFLELPEKKFGFSGSNMALLKTVLEEFEGFSIELGMVGNKLRFSEEADLFFRIKDEIKRYWYDPTIIVWHFTPPKNMRVLYYFKRALIAGRTRYKIEKWSRFSPAYWGHIKNFISFLVKTPVVLISHRKNLSSALVKRLREFGSMLGLLIG